MCYFNHRGMRRGMVSILGQICDTTTPVFRNLNVVHMYARYKRMNFLSHKPRLSLVTYNV